MKNRSAFVRGLTASLFARPARAQSAAFLPDFQRYHLEPATGAAYPARKPRNHCCT